MNSSIKVCVRVRPFNEREKKHDSRLIVQMKQNTTFLIHPSTLHLEQEKQHVQSFAYDHCFWTFDNQHCNFADQETVFETIGRPVLQNVINGFHSCVLASGMTGAGKSYSMMGSNTSPEALGLIPRICNGLMQHVAQSGDDSVFSVRVSYLEIYAEQIRDLLAGCNEEKNAGAVGSTSSSSPRGLRVREHPKTGPYVEDLTECSVSSYEEIEKLMEVGNKNRTTAATKMNDRSSRSHAMFFVTLAQTQKATGEEVMKSKLSLVDLAGSERVKDSGVSGVHLKEAANINTSLSALGRVISILSKQADASPSSSSSSHEFVPFRDSVLTWLLKENFGGNSKTVMLAAISPSELTYEETLQTLQYASRAKKIVNKVELNSKREVAVQQIQTELKHLHEALAKALEFNDQSEESQSRIAAIRENIEACHRLTADLEGKWSDTVAEHQTVQEKSMNAYRSHAKTIRSSLNVPLLFNVTPQVDFSQDNYNIPLPSDTQVGLVDNGSVVVKHDPGVVKISRTSDATLTVLVNGRILEDSTPVTLQHNDTIVIQHAAGHHTIFKFRVPLFATV